MENFDKIKPKLLALIIDDPSTILLLKNRYITDDLWQFAITQEPSLFEDVKDPSVEICITALEADGANLKILKKKHRHIPITRKMAYAAVSNCPDAIKDVPKELIDNGLMELAFDGKPSLMLDFTKIRPAYITKTLRENPSYIKYVKHINENLVCDAMLENPNIALYFDVLTPKMKSLIETNYPEMVQFIPQLFN